MAAPEDQGRHGSGTVSPGRPVIAGLGIANERRVQLGCAVEAQKVALAHEPCLLDRQGQHKIFSSTGELALPARLLSDCLPGPSPATGRDGAARSHSVR